MEPVPAPVANNFECLESTRALIAEYKKREQMYLVVVVVSLVVAIISILFK